MGTDPLFVFVALGAAIILSRIVGERALKRLSAEEKARLLDSFSGYRIYNIAALFGLFILYLAAARYFPQHYSLLTLILVISYFLVSIIMSVLSLRKLKDLNLPASYVKSFLISLGVQYAGVGVLFVPVVARIINN